MLMIDNKKLEIQLQELSKSFIASLPEQMGTIETNWARIWREGWNSPAIDSLIHQAHSLAGAAGSLGFQQIYKAASQLQIGLQNVHNNNHSEESGKLLGLLETPFQTLRRAVYTDQQIDITELTQKLGSAKISSASLEEKRSDRLIYMVEDDPIQAMELATQVGYFGYNVQVFYNLCDLEDAIRDATPTVILMDVSFPEGKMAGYEKITALRDKFSEFPPVIFISINDDMAYRLEAVRAGSTAYFTKPADVNRVIEVLDRLVFHETAVPYRILIIDDSRVQANYNASQLKKAGMITEIVSDPLRVIDQMISFNPDLLLLDMYMPDCTGTELAKVIRQMEQFVGIPIVFLSSEMDKGKQLAALGLGGDDFLTKPIESQHLISAVTTRVERYRKLRTLMINDGLTGLLNHSTTKERLVQEVENARRQNSILSFAMLDLDYFKSVNDTYGHITGDRVLKSLSNMLRQRLRVSDIIGRYGGEEFAVILPNTDEKAAYKIMSELVEGFARIHHRSGEKEFLVSFSCGVASFPAYENASALNKAADKALYAAKAAGRSRVIKASTCIGDSSPETPAQPPIENRTSGLSPATLYQNLVKHANSIILRCDLQGNLTFVNEFAQRFFGYSKGEMLGRHMVGITIAQTDSNGADLKAMIADIVRHPERYAHNENENIRKNGEQAWVVWSNAPLLDENGNLVEILCIGNDITDRKRAELNLTHTVSRLSTLNRILQAMMSQQDLASIVTITAREVVDLFNAHNVSVTLLTEDRSALEFVGDYLNSWKEPGNPADLICLQDNPLWAQAIETGKTVLVPSTTIQIPTSSSLDDLKFPGVKSFGIIPLIARGKTIGAMRIDFNNSNQQVNPSELELAEMIAGYTASVIENNLLFSAEQRQRQYFEALVENIPIAVIMVDPRAKIKSWNPAAEKLFGYDVSEVLEKDIDELLSPEENHQEAVAYTQETNHRGELIHSITHRRRKDQSQADVELLAVPLIVNGIQLGSMAIYHDISDLQRARREAEAANEAKGSFLATMSHEIRTPLNAIIGMTTLLFDTQLNDEQRQFSDTIRNSSEALLSIINDILDFSKIEAGKMDLEEQPFDLRECLESTLDLVAARATEKGIDLAYILDPDVPPVIVSDSTRLRQILLNLLSNSFKFTNEGEVVLSASAEKMNGSNDKTLRLHFSIRDTGIGIPQDRMDRLFRSFSHVDASTTRKYGGTGLGLAISKRLAELMGGTMWVESEGICGKGSTFHFTILANQSTSAVPVFLNRKQPDLAGKRVLIVDDNPTNRYILMRQVQSWGMLPKETAFPRQALQWIQDKQPFDIVLLDMQMPEMDGASLAVEIQKSADLPMIMLTSLGLKEIDIAGIKFAAYLTKPIKPAVLYKTLLNVFGAQPATLVPLKEKVRDIPLQKTLAPLRILLAEDHGVNKKVALHMLEHIGYRADVASNGLEVLEALNRQAYDVVLMDIQMPEMDGLEATRQVRSTTWTESRDEVTFQYQPYIIAMTANAMQGDREICLEAGMDDYISKPIRINELNQALNQAQSCLQMRKSISQDPVIETQGNSNGQVIDAEIFQKLHNTMGKDDHSAMISLIKDYLEETHQILTDLHQAVAQEDLEKTHRLSHSLKSSCQLFGAIHLADTCKTMELHAYNGSLQDTANLLSQAENQFEDVQHALENKLQTFHQ
jgi:diguanylate cyclase (GGDEF)-like protein/PAS domain S-box-containing protein